MRAFAPEHPAIEIVRGYAAARHLVDGEQRGEPAAQLEHERVLVEAAAGLCQRVLAGGRDRGVAPRIVSVEGERDAAFRQVRVRGAPPASEREPRGTPLRGSKLKQDEARTRREGRRRR